MRHRIPARLSQRGVVAPLIPLLAVGALLAGCHDAERSLAPKTDGLQFGLSATEDDTSRIAYHSNRDGDFDIYVMNADGSRVTQVTHNTIDEFDPNWSPNGQQIRFGRVAGCCAAAERPEILPNAICWPFGDQMAFGRISGCCAAAVVVTNADGSGERVLADNGFPGAWSPDGRQIA